MEKIKNFLTVHKMTVILIAVLVVLLGGGFVAFEKFTIKKEANIEEVDLIFDAEGPYAQLFPRKDGNALVLSIKRTSSYDSISYDLAYSSTPDETIISGGKKNEDGEGSEVSGAIDRGVSGQIDTNGKKGEYEQEILFGTCSKNVCKYDQGVENGTLTLHIKKGHKSYRMITQWHLQKVDVALGVLNSLDGHLSYKVDADRQTLSNVGFSIINDLTAVPKLPEGKQVLGKVYSLNVQIAKTLASGEVIVELAQNPPNEAKIYRFNEPVNEWQELDTNVDGSKLTSVANGAGIFAVLTSKK